MPYDIPVAEMHRHHVDYPWLEYIGSGRKIYECRLRCKILEWDLHPGLCMTFYNATQEVEVEVTGLLTFTSFKEAFDTLGQEMVPIPGITRDQVADMYRKHFSDADVAREGVCAIRIRVI